jgi:DnaJ-class molecular chaperone
MELKRCYELLELKPGASFEEVRLAYRDLVDVWHPDRFSHNPRLKKRAEERFKETSKAYETLAYYLNTVKGEPEWVGRTQGDSHLKRKSDRGEKKSNIEEFAKAGTFLFLQVWSHLTTSFIRFSKSQDNEDDDEKNQRG